VRVLMLSWEYPPSSAGGIAAHVEGLARAEVRAGHDVVMITRRTPGTAADTVVDGIRVLRVEAEMPWLPGQRVAARASANHSFVAASSLLGDWRPDVIHGHDWEVAWASDVLGTLHAVPIVTTFHGTERGRHGGHLPAGDAADINSIEWWQAFRSRRVIASTRVMAREIVAGFELDPDHVRRVPGGIDPTWWATIGPDEPADAARGRLVLAWGRVQYEKGFQVLARAIGALRQRLPGLECMIVGRGSYLPELQSQIDIAGVGNVIQVPGYVADDDLRTLIHCAGCVVIPSLYEPFGVVALEALAGGAPLIVADTGGLAELVGGTGSALLFEPGNGAELANCIERVLNDPELADEMVRRGRELLQATYTFDAIAARTVAVYHEAIESWS
jgi:glycogen(starch) synthase